MPVFEWQCQNCGKIEETLSPIEGKELLCCGKVMDRKPSIFIFKVYNPFKKDGEGFSSVRYSKQEAKERIRANAGKYD